MDDSTKQFKHGGSSGYNYHKCRCDQCVEWKKQQRIKERDSGASAAQQRAYRQKNLERVREREAKARERMLADPERRAKYEEYQRNYARENLERKTQAAREWREEKPHLAWVSQFCAVSAYRGAPIPQDVRSWMEQLDTENPPCTYCGGKWETLDHIIPISRGGDSSSKNLTPCCHRCNRSKGATDPYVWAARLATRRQLPSV